MRKIPNRIKQTIAFFGWGLLAMVLIFALILVSALIGWGI